MATAVQIRNTSTTLISIAQSPEVPTVSRESHELLENEVFSNQTYCVKRAFTNACSLADRANHIQDLAKTVDPNGNELVAHARKIANILGVLGLILFIAAAPLGAYMAVALNFDLLPTFVAVGAMFLYFIPIAFTCSRIKVHHDDVIMRTNKQQLALEWQQINDEKEQMNNICMGVLDLPSYIGDDPSLRQAKRELTEVWDWVRA